MSFPFELHHTMNGLFAFVFVTYQSFTVLDSSAISSCNVPEKLRNHNIYLHIVNIKGLNLWNVYYNLWFSSLLFTNCQNHKYWMSALMTRTTHSQNRVTESPLNCITNNRFSLLLYICSHNLGILFGLKIHASRAYYPFTLSCNTNYYL